jgi:hypothetical protein
VFVAVLSSKPTQLFCKFSPNQVLFFWCFAIQFLDGHLLGAIMAQFDFIVEARPSTRHTGMEGWYQIVVCHGKQKKPVTDWQAAPQANDNKLHSVLNSAAALAKQQIQVQFH